jgi:6-phosphogluconolactonase
MQPEIRIFDAAADLFQTAAREFARRALEAVSQRGRFVVALSGGSTPKYLFPLLADPSRFKIPWEHTYIFWGDERHVPPDNPESNFKLANDTLLSKVPAPPGNVFRVHAEEDAGIAAQKYEEDIRKIFSLARGQFPRFDLIMLGMGPDGHTASLFPGSAALKETERLVVANWVEKFKSYRITFTYPVLNHAACVMFIVTGAEKAPAVKQVLTGSGDGPPAKLVRPPDGDLIWLLDRAAAAELSS